VSPAVSHATRARSLDELKAALLSAHGRAPSSEPTAGDLAQAEASLARARERVLPHLEAGHPGLAALLTLMDPRQWYAMAARNDPPALTMVGQTGLDNVQFCVEAALADGVPGDLLEAGVWRGGVAVLMRGILDAHGVTDRSVWAADSFAGLPEPDPTVDPEDALAHELLACVGGLSVGRPQVEAAFREFDLLDGQVRFLEGWFEDTLPGPVERLAVLRLDGDYYTSTRDVLEALYPRVSPGGYVIVDDYGLPVGCRRAVDEYREREGVGEPILMVTDHIACWRKDG
jgi:hypothetical protein